jgi:uncharacterized protein YcnI
MFAGAASAHITVSPSTAAQGSFTEITFRVPTESDTASTTVVDVHLDERYPVATVDYAPVPGWKTVVRTTKLASPITEDDGNQVTSVVSEIIWTATSPASAIAPGQFRDFPIELGPLPKAPSLEFKMLQTYSDGTVVHWIDDTPQGGPEPEHPAPVLTLTLAGSVPASAAPSAAPATTASAPAGGSGSGALTVAIIALLLGLVGAVLGGVAYGRTRGPGGQAS